jgi:hypothetical protein
MTGGRASSPFPSSVSRWNCLEIRSDQLAVKHTKLTSACDLPDGDRDATAPKRPEMDEFAIWALGSVAREAPFRLPIREDALRPA